MNIEKFSSKQCKSLIIMFILGTSLIISGGGKSVQNSWISITLGMISAIPIVLIYSKLLLIFPGLGLYDILIKVYGKFVGKLLIFSYTFYFFHLSVICLRNVTEYVQVVSFPGTPQYVTAILLGALILYSINSDFSVIIMWAKKILPIIIAMLFITFILGIPHYKPSNLKPLLYNGWKPVIDSGFTTLTFPFAETVVFLVFLGYLYDTKESGKTYIQTILIGGIILVLTSLRNIMLLGFPNLKNVYFPSHYATSLINIAGFVQRIEILVSLNLILTSFAKIIVCLYGSSLGVLKLLNLKNIKKSNYILTILMIIVSMLLYKSTMEMFKFILYYRYYVIPFQFVIPILTLIIAGIKKRRKGKA